MLNDGERGQSLLEALVTVAAVLLAIGIATAALHINATNRQPQSARLAALESAQNAATEIVAATAYDSDALWHLAAAQWQSGSTLLSLVPLAPGSGQTRAFVLHYKGSGGEGDLPFSVRSVAPPPGAVLDPSATPGP